jgi:hypothetical protein
MVASVSDESSPPSSRVSGQTSKLVFGHKGANLLPFYRRARQMRLPTSYTPALAHRSKTVPPRPRSLLPSTSARPPPSDETAADHPTRPSIEQPKPRAGISSLLSLPSQHNLHGASPTGVGRPTFSARSTDDHNGAYRRGLLLPPPSPTRSTVSQPAAVASTGTAATAAAFVLGGGGDSEAARVSLWAELKDVRKRGTRTPGTTREQQQQPSSP